MQLSGEERKLATARLSTLGISLCPWEKHLTRTLRRSDQVRQRLHNVIKVRFGVADGRSMLVCGEQTRIIYLVPTHNTYTID